MSNTIKNIHTLSIEALSMVEGYSHKFNFKAVKTYDSHNNYLLAQLSDLVYKEKSEIESQLKAWQKADTGIALSWDIIDINDFRFMVLSTKEYIIISFRGTINIKNWLVDAEIQLVPFKEGKGLVHKGFYSSVLSMKSSIDETIKKHTYGKSQHLYITGHSLGGAQAILSAFTCSELKNFTSITTFGQPKVGDYDFVQYINKHIDADKSSMNSKYFRIVNGWDIVTQLPWFYLNHYYYHAGKFYIYCYSKGDNYKVEVVEELADNELISVDQDKLVYQALINFNYHSMSLYLYNAEQNKNNPVFANDTEKKKEA